MFDYCVSAAYQHLPGLLATALICTAYGNRRFVLQFIQTRKSISFTRYVISSKSATIITIPNLTTYIKCNLKFI